MLGHDVILNVPGPDLSRSEGVQREADDALTQTGTELSASNVRREVRRVIEGAGLVAQEVGTPRELRHSFVTQKIKKAASRIREAALEPVGDTGIEPVTSSV